jgi:hypothetical protein
MRFLIDQKVTLALWYLAACVFYTSNCYPQKKHARQNYLKNYYEDSYVILHGFVIFKVE